MAEEKNPKQETKTIEEMIATIQQSYEEKIKQIDEQRKKEMEELNNKIDSMRKENQKIVQGIITGHNEVIKEQEKEQQKEEDEDLTPIEKIERTTLHDLRVKFGLIKK